MARVGRLVSHAALRYAAPGGAAGQGAPGARGGEGARVSHALLSSSAPGPPGAAPAGPGADVPASGSGGGTAEPYRNRLRRRAERDDVEGRSSGQEAALVLSDAATSAVTSRRCAAGEGASWPPSEPASAASDGARASACCEPADSDASPGDITETSDVFVY